MTIQTDQEKFNKVVATAQANLRKMAKHQPYLFPEYSTLLAAKEELAAAKQKVQRAQAAWDRIRK